MWRLRARERRLLRVLRRLPWSDDARGRGALRATTRVMFQGFERGCDRDHWPAPRSRSRRTPRSLLDARDANEATYDVGEDITEVIADGRDPRSRSSDISGVNSTAITFGPRDSSRHRPSRCPIGYLAYSSEWIVTGAEVTYLLTLPEPDVIPADLTYEIGPDQLAEITSGLSSDVDRQYVFGRHSFNESGSGGGLSWAIDVPTSRTDRVTTDGLTWRGVLTARRRALRRSVREVSARVRAGDAHGRTLAARARAARRPPGAAPVVPESATR